MGTVRIGASLKCVNQKEKGSRRNDSGILAESPLVLGFTRGDFCVVFVVIVLRVILLCLKVVNVFD